MLNSSHHLLTWWKLRWSFIVQETWIGSTQLRWHNPSQQKPQDPKLKGGDDGWSKQTQDQRSQESLVIKSKIRCESLFSPNIRLQSDLCLSHVTVWHVRVWNESRILKCETTTSVCQLIWTHTCTHQCTGVFYMLRLERNAGDIYGSVSGVCDNLLCNTRTKMHGKTQSMTINCRGTQITATRKLSEGKSPRLSLKRWYTTVSSPVKAAYPAGCFTVDKYQEQSCKRFPLLMNKLRSRSLTFRRPLGFNRTVSKLH